MESTWMITLKGNKVNIIQLEGVVYDLFDDFMCMRMVRSPQKRNMENFTQKFINRFLLVSV